MAIGLEPQYILHSCNGKEPRSLTSRKKARRESLETRQNRHESKARERKGDLTLKAETERQRVACQYQRTGRGKEKGREERRIVYMFV